MNIIRYIDLVDDLEPDEDGVVQQVVIKRNFTLPTIIDSSKIEVISPLFTITGRLYKNVSVIEYGDSVLKVVGNYKKLNKLKGIDSNFVGFKK